MKSINIEEFFNKKIAASREDLIGDTPDAKAEFAKIVSLIEKLESEVLRRLITESSGILVFYALSSSIRELELHKGWVGEIFARLDSGIRLQFGNGSRFLRELNTAGINYLKTVLKSDFSINQVGEIENNRLLEIIQQIKDEIEAMKTHEIRAFDVDNVRFELAALEELQEELENEFAKRKVLAQQKQELELIKEKEQTEELKDVPPRTQRQVFLILEIILRLLRINGNKTEQAKLMYFLSGYSAELMRQSFSTSENWKNKLEDLQYLSELCSESRLTSVKKEIDKEIDILTDKSNKR